MYNKLNIS